MPGYEEEEGKRERESVCVCVCVCVCVRVAGWVERERERERGKVERSDAPLSQSDDVRIVSGSLDRSINVWDPDLGTCITSLSGHGDAVTCLQFFDYGLAVRALYLFDPPSLYCRYQTDLSTAFLCLPSSSLCFVCPHCLPLVRLYRSHCADVGSAHWGVPPHPRRTCFWRQLFAIRHAEGDNSSSERLLSRLPPSSSCSLPSQFLLLLSCSSSDASHCHSLSLAVSTPWSKYGISEWASPYTC